MSSDMLALFDIDRLLGGAGAAVPSAGAGGSFGGAQSGGVAIEE